MGMLTKIKTSSKKWVSGSLRIVFAGCVFALVNANVAWAEGQALAVSSQVPDIKIGGKSVLTNEQIKTTAFDDNLPESLKNSAAKAAIENRRAIQVWSHSPKRGVEQAPVTIVEINDMSCLYCQNVAKAIDAVFEDETFAGKIQHIYMHLPLDQYNMTNAAAFYSRLAYDAKHFWAYRQSLYKSIETTDNAFIARLLSVGVAEKDIRQMTRENARQYYKELDADTKAVREMGETMPPVLFVNGIKVGGSIPLTELKSLVEYEIKLFEKRQ